jgi:hypothetical protein
MAFINQSRRTKYHLPEPLRPCINSEIIRQPLLNTDILDTARGSVRWPAGMLWLLRESASVS